MRLFVSGILSLIVCAAQAQIPNSTATVQPTEAPAPAKAKSQRINVTAGAIRINYGQPRWNKSATAIDTATVIMREAATGRIVQIQLNETAPDSSLFSGLYLINWQNMSSLQTEFYIPPQDVLAQKDGLMKIAAKINAKEIKRNPFILRRSIDNEQSIEIFDTVEQARTAMKAYKAEQVVAIQNQKPTKFPSDQDIDVQKEAALQKQREEAARAESDRARLAQIEAARLSDLMAQQAKLNAAEREKKKALAAKLGNDGLGFYKAEDYENARKSFDQALTLDPDNRAFYYQYGVTLYKLDEFDRALVFLELANGKDVNAAERNYFIGLAHVKLKETDQALRAFDEVVAAKDPVMTPSALYYKGALYYEQAQYDDAQKAFQAVLDTSKDPKLDERAEAFIEQILRARQLAEERKQKWTLSFAIGEMYDSNVLLSSNSQRDAGQATGSAGWRTLLSGSTRFRPVYDDDHEFAAQLDALTLYTVDSSLAYSQDLRNADPTVVTLTLPWTHKGTWEERGHKFDISPGFESTFMSIEDNTQKAIILSPLLSFSNLLVMNDRWFNTVTLDIRNDLSRLASSVGDDDSSAMKFRLGTSNLLYVDKLKGRILLPEFAATLNQAAGRNAYYQRIDLGLGYLMPTWFSTTTNFKLSYFYLDYAQKLPATRADNSYTATVGVSKRLSTTWTSGLLGTYNINNSNEDANTYNKFTVLLTLSAAYGF